MTGLLKDAVESEIIEKAPDNNIIHYRDADPEIKNRLIAAHPSLKYIISHHEIEQDISCFVCREAGEDGIPDCLIIGKEDDELVMMWAQSRDNKMDLLRLLKFALDEACKKYDMQQRIRIPYINDQSKKLILKILGEKAVVSETVWTASLPLDGPLEPLQPGDPLYEEQLAG